MAYRRPLAPEAKPYRPLPWPPGEARQVAPAASGSVVLQGPAATAAAVREALRRHRVVHLATHAVVEPRNPMLSSALLANGGQLTVHEQVGVALDADLVVLNAFDTGRGEVTGGEDVIGLVRGLLGAGARTVIAALLEGVRSGGLPAHGRG